MSVRRAIFWWLAAALVLVGCGGTKDPETPIGLSDKNAPSVVSSRPVDYGFDPIDDDRPLTSKVTLGKPTVLAFIVTGDIIGQAQVDFLLAMHKRDGDRTNYGLVAIHPRRELVLVSTYARTLGVKFPVALGDAKDLGINGPFGEIPAVPTIVILDRQGRLVFKHTGLAKSELIRTHLRGL